MCVPPPRGSFCPLLVHQLIRCLLACILSDRHITPSNIQGMLCADVIGFHAFDHARHFLNACKRILGLSYFNKSGCVGWSVDSLIHAFTHSFIHSFIHSFMHSLHELHTCQQRRRLVLTFHHQTPAG